MTILDTNVLSEMLRPAPSPQVADWLARQVRADVYTTAITQAEMLAGIEVLPAGKRKAQLAAEVADIFSLSMGGRVLPFDDRAASAFALVVAARKAMGRPISQFDAMIAAIARSQRALLATRDISGFDHCGIRLSNPWRDKP